MNTTCLFQKKKSFLHSNVYWTLNMSLQAEQNVEKTVNSQEVLNIQTSFVGDAYSGTFLEHVDLHTY